MVDEEDVRRLHAVLRERLGAPAAREVAQAAGTATADYLLAHRIPRPLQTVLHRLPARWAARVMLAAITRNAWTFVGSGRFAASAGGGARPVTLEIRANPLCRDLRADAPACDYYAATFERLFARLVHPRAQVREVACEACGDAACRFEIRW
jgi:divinyl protochlorophyllide a 8-vinyl-reductase